MNRWKSYFGENRWRIKIIGCMLLSFLIYLILIMQEYPLHTSSDELGTISGPAYLAGRDWSGVMEGVGYYGAGYHILFFWIFMLTKNPVIIYRLILLFGVLLRVLIIPLVFYIGNRYINIKNGNLNLITAFLCSFAYTTRIGSISNEYIIEILVWVILLFICKLIEFHGNKKKQNVYAFLLSAVLMYGLTIHTRALTLVIATGLTFLFLRIIFKKKFIGKWHVGVAVILYIGARISIKFIQINIWGTTEGLRNGTVTIAQGIDIFNYKTWVLWLDMLIGAVNTMTLVTGGFFIVVIVAIIKYFCQFLKKDNKIRDINIYCSAIVIIMVLCTGATLAALLVSDWFIGSYPVFEIGKTAPNIYALKGVTYVRYWEPYVPPLIVCGIAILEQRKEWNKIFPVAVCITAFLQLIFIKMALPLIENNGSSLTPLYSLALYKWKDPVDRNSYLCCVMLMFGIVLISLFNLYRNRKELITATLAGFLIYQQVWGMVYFDFPVQREMFGKIDATYYCMWDMDKSNVQFDNIYALDTSEEDDNNWKIYYILQFYLNNYTVNIQLPEQYEKNDLLIANSYNQDIIPQNVWYKCIQLDEDEFWYVFNERYADKIESSVKNE